MCDTSCSFSLKYFFHFSLTNLYEFTFQVCPTFSSSIIKQILENFQPDEFCPDPVPLNVFEALESEVCSLNFMHVSFNYIPFFDSDETTNIFELKRNRFRQPIT